MRMLEPGLHRSVDETYALIAQARRIRSEYLRASFWQLVAWARRRWSRNRRGGEQVAPSPADTLKKAA